MATPQECWDLALESFGTADIFEQRARTLSTRIRLLGFTGLVQSVLVGAVVTSFGIDFKYLKGVLVAVGAIAVAQAVLSLWSLFANWDSSLSYASESQADNTRISRRFVDLVTTQNNTVEFQVRRAEYEAREGQDSKQHITEKEKRRGMRAGLRQFKRACAQCQVVPASMTPTKCPVCGNP